MSNEFYKALADADPDLNGDLQTSFDALKAQTVTQSRGVYKMNYISIAGDVGYTTASALESFVNAGITAGTIPKWAGAAMEGVGLDINNPDTHQALAEMVTAGYPAAMRDEILAQGDEQIAAFPQLREQSQLAKARNLRAEGKV